MMNLEIPIIEDPTMNKDELRLVSSTEEIHYNLVTGLMQKLSISSFQEFFNTYELKYKTERTETGIKMTFWYERRR